MSEDFVPGRCECTHCRLQQGPLRQQLAAAQAAQEAAEQRVARLFCEAHADADTEVAPGTLACPACEIAWGPQRLAEAQAARARLARVAVTGKALWEADARRPYGEETGTVWEWVQFTSAIKALEPTDLADAPGPGAGEA